jgi:hypothetical protein
MRGFYKFLEKISSGPLVIVSVLIFALFIAVILPGQKAKTGEYAGDAGSVDTSFFPKPDQVYTIAEAYGEHGREQYIKARYTFDVIWPLAYTFFMVALITFCTKKIFGAGSKWIHLNLIAIGPIVFDFIENGFAMAVMSAYPDRMDGVVYVMATATMIKWVIMGVAQTIMFCGIIALPIVLIVRRVKSRQT